MTRWRETLHPRDPAGKFTTGHGHDTPNRAAQVQVRSAGPNHRPQPVGGRRPNEAERLEQLEALPRRAVLDLAQRYHVEQDLIDGYEDGDRGSIRQVHRQIVDEERAEGLVERGDGGADRRREQAREQAQREEAARNRAATEQALDEFRVDNPPHSEHGRTDLPPDVDMVDMEDLRRDLKYSGDGFNLGTGGGWGELLQRQMEDPSTPSRIRALAESGMLPLHIVDGDEIRNGHHRLAVAALMGVRQVPVSRRDYEDFLWSQDRASRDPRFHFQVPFR